MPTITELFIHVNSHNAPAILDIVSNKKNFSKIKWSFKKHSTDILTRCVEVHAKECFNILLDVCVFDTNLEYRNAMTLACENYIDYPCDENLYYINKLITKKPEFSLTFIQKIIQSNNVNLFKINQTIINYNQIEIVKTLLNVCCNYDNIGVFEIIFENSSNIRDEFFNAIVRNIFTIKSSKMFLNYLANHGFNWTEYLDFNFYDMSKECFDYLYIRLKQTKNFVHDDFTPLINFEFVEHWNIYHCENKKYMMYKLLKLPVKYTNLPMILLRTLPNKSSFGYLQNSYDTLPFIIAIMLFELRNEEMKHILSNPENIIYKKLDQLIEANNNDKAAPLDHRLKFKGIISDFIYLIKNCVGVVPVHYYQYLENYKPIFEKDYNNWKISNVKELDINDESTLNKKNKKKSIVELDV
jgi:hypothetical protein